MKAVFTITCPAVLGAGVAGHLIQLVEGRQSLAETAAISFADTRISTPYLFLNPFSTHIAPCSAGEANSVEPVPVLTSTSSSACMPLRRSR